MMRKNFLTRGTVQFKGLTKLIIYVQRNLYSATTKKYLHIRNERVFRKT